MPNIFDENLEDDDDQDEPETHKKRTRVTFTAVKVVTILLGLTIIAHLVYQLMTIIQMSQKVEENDNKKETNLILFSVCRIPIILFYSLLLFFESDLGSVIVVFIVTIYPMVDLFISVFAIFFIDYRNNILVLVLQLSYTELSFILFFCAVLKLLSKRSHQTKKEETKQEKTTDVSESTQQEKAKRRKKYELNTFKILKSNLITISMMFAVISLVSHGYVFRFGGKQGQNNTNSTVVDSGKWTAKQLNYLGFLGEVFVRAVNCLMIPLISSSLIYSMAAINITKMFQMAIRLIIYNLVTTLIAVILGIGLGSLMIGSDIGFRETVLTDQQSFERTDRFLNIIRNLIPVNIFWSNKTKADSDRMDIHSDQINILGIISVAIVVGLTLGSLSKQCRPLIIIIGSLNNILVVIISYVIRILPIAIIFMVLPLILSAHDFKLILNVGIFSLTVLVALLIQMFVILPLIYFVMTFKSPFKFMNNMMSALMMAFATASPSATIPVTMRCLEENNFINESVFKFCIPVSASINMFGTALYGAVSAVFFYRLLGKELAFVDTFHIGLTVTLTSIGAAGVSQSGVTTVIILSALGLPQQLAGLVLMFEIILHRFRSLANVMCDSYGAGIVNKGVIQAIT